MVLQPRPRGNSLLFPPLVETTPHHPFFTVERGWVNAEDLRPGDHVPSTDGSAGVVSSVTWTGGSATMYDLTVEVAHTYFVGEGEWLVHNCGLPAMDPALIRYSQNSMGSAFRNGQSVQNVANALASGRLSPSALPPIRLVERGGHFYTLDNRRLAAFQTAGIPVPYRMATPREIASEAWKFTTQNDGIGIQLTLPLN